MRERIRIALFLAIVLAFAGCGPEGSSNRGDGASQPRPSADRPAEVRLEVVKYNQLLDALKAQHGQVVVLDVWATWCIPCTQEFPHLVELHRQYAKDGVVCVSVSLDEPKLREAALKFLKSTGATFPNYLLDEGEAGWDKLGLKGIPAVFVYDREGKLARKFTNDDPDNQYTYADVEKFVQGLLAPSRNGQKE